MQFFDLHDLINILTSLWSQSLISKKMFMTFVIFKFFKPSSNQVSLNKFCIIIEGKKN